MKKKFKKLVKKPAVAAAVVIVVIGFVALVAKNYNSSTSFKYTAPEAQVEKPEQNKQDDVKSATAAEEKVLEEVRKNSDILKISDRDFTLGDKNAPVTMIEYASLSCPHCASFARESFEKLKSEFIDTGKVQFAFRSFPLNQAALNAAMFATCQAKDNKSDSVEKYYFTIKALFKTQDSWAFDANHVEKLEAIAGLDGMDSEGFKKCISDKSEQERVLVERMEAAKVLQIKSAPSFFVNGEISEGYVDYLTLKKLIEKKLSEAAK